MRSRTRLLLRISVVISQAATVAITWPLWQVREQPPLLPVAEVPHVSFGWLLLLTLGLALVRPIAGCVSHLMVLAVAVLCDQTREQPQVLSLALLLAATMPVRGARELGLLHLAALWFWSGLGKLTSARFLQHGGEWLLTGDAVGSATGLGIGVAIAIGATEIVLGVLALFPRTRPVTAWLGGAMHLFILVLLSPLGRNWNPAVWPWNAALALASVLSLREVRGGSRELVARGGPLARSAALAFLALPVGFHLGFVDAPVAFQVYTENACHGVVLRSSGPPEAIGELPSLRANLPRVPRLYRRWFAEIGRPGDRLLLVDDRPLAGLLGAREQFLSVEEVR